MTSIKNKNILLFITIILFSVPFFASASNSNGTIDPTYKYAWSNNVGWINFAPTGDGSVYKGLVIVDNAVTGYAWSKEHGWINFGPFANNAVGGVKNTSEGVLSGYAWGQELGWINFSGVSINSVGNFTGRATGDLVGTINFDLTQCTNCGVKTDWRPSYVRSLGGVYQGGSRLLPVSDTSTSVPPSVSVVPNTEPPAQAPTPTLNPNINSTTTQNTNNVKNNVQEIPKQIIENNIGIGKTAPANQNTNVQISPTLKQNPSFFARVGGFIQTINSWFVERVKSVWSFFF